MTRIIVRGVKNRYDNHVIVSIFLHDKPYKINKIWALSMLEKLGYQFDEDKVIVERHRQDIYDMQYISEGRSIMHHVDKDEIAVLESGYSARVNFYPEYYLIPEWVKSFQEVE